MALPSTIVLADLTPGSMHMTSIMAQDFEVAYSAFARDFASLVDVDSREVVPTFIHLIGYGLALGKQNVPVLENGRCAMVGFFIDPDGEWDDVNRQTCRRALLSVRSFLPDAPIDIPLYLVNISQEYEAVPSLSAAVDAILNPDSTQNHVVNGADDNLHFSFKGGLMLGGGHLYDRWSNAPRMGTVRHRVSEAMDELVHAVMGGEYLAPKSARLCMPRLVYQRLSKAASAISDEIQRIDS
ncbi:hypothetical protein [uncultured Slackia sp.]|uniref:hypothetical protein n=1 Tax=uncultured Slackia sp. TaxID=665903 RepID=UPI0025CBD713|nr:hypothetical protein [uncultured Slackia sp.]